MKAAHKKGGAEGWDLKAAELRHRFQLFFVLLPLKSSREHV